jgi:hypothetical protein
VWGEVVDGYATGGMTSAESARWFRRAPAEASLRAVPPAPGADVPDWEFGASDFRLPAPEQLAGFPGESVAGPDRAWADLWTANLDQLAAAGVLLTNIHLAALCTACRRDLFYSYRADKTPHRTAAAIRMRHMKR